MCSLCVLWWGWLCRHDGGLCCRLLGRLRSNFQLSEIVSVDNYEPWITAVASFTVSSLQVRRLR